MIDPKTFKVRLDAAIQPYLNLGYKNEPFSEAVRRAAYNKTQTGIAKELGCTYVRVHSWFAGVSLPKLEIIAKLETVLNVPVGYFYVLIARDKLLTGDNNDDK